MRHMLIAVLLVLAGIAGAADDAVMAPREATGLGPQAPSLDMVAITIPQMLSYQGKLTDTLGSPVADTTYSVAFRLYPQPTGGTAFWNETQTVRTRSGLFSSLLGSVTPIGSMPDAGAVYLGMAIEGGTELTPRLRVVSSAYAFVADEARHADTADYALSGGSGGSVTSVSQSTGIVCTPNPITTTGTVGFDQSWGDNRYVNATSDSMSGSLALTQDLRVYGEAQIGYGCSRVGSWAFTAGYNDTADGSYSVAMGNGNYASGRASVVSGGDGSGALADYSVVGGGRSNFALGWNSTVGGGEHDSVRGYWGGVSSGRENRAGNAPADTAAVVAGGWRNKVDAAFSCIGGGRDNDIYGSYSVIGGGQDNITMGGWSTVAGGFSNSTEASYTSVGGGRDNYAGEYYGTIAGGDDNHASGECATVGGGRYCRAVANYAVVAGGDSNIAFHMAAVGGGEHNRAQGYWSTVAGGGADTAYAHYGAALSGYNNLAGDASADTGAVVAGGRGNRALAKDVTIGGGRGNIAVNAATTVGGGSGNYATGSYAAISGGSENYTSGWYSAVPGGYADTCAGHYAMVMGNKVRATSSADFTFAYGEDFTTTTARAVVFYHSGAATKLGVGVQNPTHYVDVTGGSYCDASGWHNGSSRKLKKDVAAMTADEIRELAAQLKNLDVVRFRYRRQDDEKLHVGVIAEDAPDVLVSAKHDALSTGDAIGFLLAVAKAQQEQNQAQQAEIEALKARLDNHR